MGRKNKQDATIKKLSRLLRKQAHETFEYNYKKMRQLIDDFIKEHGRLPTDFEYRGLMQKGLELDAK